jgi:2-polyprenyl-3-methyl-5-hydroxy-6-metoxy-1,4-benzoquinol methylase
MELLDGSNIDERLALQSYRFMAVVNKYFGGTAVVRDFITGQVRGDKRARPLKILDIGSGSCDIPAAICGWAQKAGPAIEVTCVEPSDYAVQAAKKNIGQYPNIKLLQQDIFSYRPVEKYDCAVGSLFFHHLSNQRIAELMGRLRTFGCRSVLINDLNRSLRCYIGCLLASLFVPAGVRHDALLSIRKGFRPEELKNLLENGMQKETTASRVDVWTAWFGRVCAVVRFEMEASQ